MPSEEDNEVDLDSTPLFDYLKKEIPVDELRDFSSSRRIESIDFVKGIAIVFVIGAQQLEHGSFLTGSFFTVLVLPFLIYLVRPYSSFYPL